MRDGKTKLDLCNIGNSIVPLKKLNVKDNTNSRLT
jgi:hypothetical protein